MSTGSAHTIPESHAHASDFGHQRASSGTICAIVLFLSSLISSSQTVLGVIAQQVVREESANVSGNLNLVVLDVINYLQNVLEQVSLSLLGTSPAMPGPILAPIQPARMQTAVPNQ